MAKTILIFKDSNGVPILDAVSVVLNGPAEGTPTDHSSTVYGTSTGSRIFGTSSALAAGSYTVKFDTVENSDLSPMWISGPFSGFSLSAGIIQTEHLANQAVTNIKVANVAIEADQIASGAVTDSKVSSISGTKISDASLTKAKPDGSFFSGFTMVNNGGWGVKYNASFFQIGVSGLAIKDHSITADQLALSVLDTDNIADYSVTAIKIGTGAVTTAKIGTNAVITAKIIDDAVTTDKVVDLAITNDKLAASSLTQAKWDATDLIAFRSSLSGLPTNVAYVSSDYGSDAHPYYSSLQNAIDYIESVSGGTVFIYPGIYNGPFTMTDSVNLIGADRYRCRLFHEPTVAYPACLTITSAGTDPVLLNELSIWAISDNIHDTPAIGIDATGMGYRQLILDDVLFKVKGKNDTNVAWPAKVIKIYDVKMVLKDVEMEVEGGNGSGGSNDGADATGISMEGDTTYDDIQVIRTRIKAIAGTSAGGSAGKGYGVYIKHVSSELLMDDVTIDSSDESIITEGVGVDTYTPTLISTKLKNAAQSSVDDGGTGKYVNVTVDSNVKVNSVE